MFALPFMPCECIKLPRQKLISCALHPFVKRKWTLQNVQWIPNVYPHVRRKRSDFRAQCTTKCVSGTSVRARCPIFLHNSNIGNPIGYPNTIEHLQVTAIHPPVETRSMSEISAREKFLLGVGVGFLLAQLPRLLYEWACPHGRDSKSKTKAGTQHDDAINGTSSPYAPASPLQQMDSAVGTRSWAMLEQEFRLPAHKLHELVRQFARELQRGLERPGQTIKARARVGSPGSCLAAFLFSCYNLCFIVFCFLINFPCLCAGSTIIIMHRASDSKSCFNIQMLFNVQMLMKK